MRVSVFVAFIIIVIFSSCKKSSKGLPLNTIQATINGKVMTFKSGVSVVGAEEPTIAPNYDLDIIGGASNDSGQIFISLTSGSPFFPMGIFSENYPEYDAGIYYTPSLAVLGSDYYNGHITSNPFIVKIISRSTNSMTGIFQGNIYLNRDTTQPPLIITNGQFNISDTL